MRTRSDCAARLEHNTDGNAGWLCFFGLPLPHNLKEKPQMNYQNPPSRANSTEGERLRILVIGSREGVTETIHTRLGKLPGEEK